MTAPNKTMRRVFSFRSCDVSKPMSVLSPCRLLFGVLLLGVILAGCSKSASKTAPPPPVVSVVQPVAREVVEWDEYIGRLESPETVEVRARVSGYLDKVHFKEGKEVKKGDLLFTIDRRPYQAEFDRAEAEHQRAESQAELAKNDAERAKRLIATKAISEEDFDTKTQDLRFGAGGGEIRQGRAGLGQAQSGIHRDPLADRRAHRPRAGHGGQSRQRRCLGGAGATLLTTIVSQDPLYCYVDVDERSILKYLQLRREGKRVSARDAEIPVEMALADEDGLSAQGLRGFRGQQG